MEQRTASLAPSALALVVVAWTAGAVVLALTDLLTIVPALVPLIAIGSVVVCIIAYRRSARLRAGLARLDLRYVILAHALRAPIGLFFMHQMRAGVLPELFAQRAAPGDLAIGVLAVGAAVYAANHPKVVVAWCVLGLCDLALALGTAQYLLFVAGDPRIQAIADLPYALLPLMIVPLFVVSHIYVLVRALRGPWIRPRRVQ